MATVRSGASVGSALRATVRTYRQETKRISLEDWGRIGGSSAVQLEPMVTLEPELDVNEMPSRLLELLLNNPDWKVTLPEAKLDRIVAERALKPLTNQQLKEILDLPDGHLLLSYLGTKTRFIGGQVTGHGTLEFVLYLDRPDAGGIAPRILQTRWTPQ